MKSWEVLKEVIDEVGAKAVAARLHISAALVYKWCQEPVEEDPDSSGARNPLDRMATIFELTRDARLVNWLCNVAGGFYVANPARAPGSAEEQLLGTTQRMVQDFGALLSDVSRSIENDGVITPEEADDIRQSWERLKSQCECFVVACEREFYKGARRREGDKQ